MYLDVLYWNIGAVVLLAFFLCLLGSDAAERIVAFFASLWTLAWLSAVGWGIFAAIHFLTKYW